jgi:hypothetical protein
MVRTRRFHDYPDFIRRMRLHQRAQRLALNQLYLCFTKHCSLQGNVQCIAAVDVESIVFCFVPGATTGGILEREAKGWRADGVVMFEQLMGSSETTEYRW